jgi:PAS domain-containing protein
VKRIVTCNMEGVIKTMNNPAEEIFGYDKNEFIGKKRVSIFSTVEIVFQNIPNWLEIASITFYMAIEFNSLLFTALLFVVIYGGRVCIHWFKNYDNRLLVSANWGIIKLHAGYCILVISSFIIPTLL